MSKKRNGVYINLVQSDRLAVLVGQISGGQSANPTPSRSHVHKYPLLSSINPRWHVRRPHTSSLSQYMLGNASHLNQNHGVSCSPSRNAAYRSIKTSKESAHCVRLATLSSKYAFSVTFIPQSTSSHPCSHSHIPDPLPSGSHVPWAVTQGGEHRDTLQLAPPNPPKHWQTSSCMQYPCPLQT